MLLLVTAACVLAQPAFIPPNITVLFLSDDHNAADYGMAGNPAVHTPAVDRLAREGVRFVNAYTPMAMCAPSRSALYTARYPMRSGAFANHYPVYKGVPSVTGRLQEEGWAVHLVGKSHVNEATSTSFEGYPTNKATATTFNFTSRNGTQSYYPNAATTSQLVEQIEPLLFRHKFSGVPMCLVVASYLPHGPYPSAPINYTNTIYGPCHPEGQKNSVCPSNRGKTKRAPGCAHRPDPDTRTLSPCAHNPPAFCDWQLLPEHYGRERAVGGGTRNIRGARPTGQHAFRLRFRPRNRRQVDGVRGRPQGATGRALACRWRARG
jgi:hypothetical protein